jgi:hypothetical protein
MRNKIYWQSYFGWKLTIVFYYIWESSWSWSVGSWIYNYLCTQCPPSLTLWVLDTTLCYKVCQWLVPDQWFSPGSSVSSTNKTDGHDITEILLKVALNTITITPSRFHNVMLHHQTLKTLLSIVSSTWSWCFLWKQHLILISSNSYWFWFFFVFK